MAPSRKPLRRGRHRERRIADVAEDHTVLIGEHDAVLRMQHLPRQPKHLDAGDRATPCRCVRAGVEVAALDHQGFLDLQRIKGVAGKTTTP